MILSERICGNWATLAWTDNAVNENEYRVFRNGKLLETLAANSTSYTDNSAGESAWTHKVEAFNGAGNSSRAEVDSPVCIK